MDNEEQKMRTCKECRKELYIGDEVKISFNAVLGITRPIPLEEMEYFHNSDCFIRYVCNSNGESLPKRIP